LPSLRSETCHQHIMKKFSNLKRDFRTLYKPRGRDRRRENAQALSEDDSESLRPHTHEGWVGRPTGLDPTQPRYHAVEQAESIRSERENIMHDFQHANPAYCPQRVIEESIQSMQRPDDRIGSSAQERETQDEGDVISYTEPFVFEKLPDQETVMEGTKPSTLKKSQDQAATEDTDPNALEDSEIQEAMPSDTEPDLQNQEEVPEETEPLTFEEAQAIRDQSYLAFASEEEDDFTDGPARFVLGVDGIKQCAALLLTYELSQKIQKAIHAQREYVRIEDASLSQRQALSRLEGDVRRQVASCNTRLAIMEEENRLDSDDARNLEQQREKLELMVEDVQS
jgi:hypothetical protein